MGGGGRSPWKENWEIVFDFFQAKWEKFLLPLYKHVLFFFGLEFSKILINSCVSNYWEVSPSDQEIKISVSFSPVVMVNVTPKGLLSSERAINPNGSASRDLHGSLFVANLTVNHLHLGAPTTPTAETTPTEVALPPTSRLRPRPSRGRSSLVEKLFWSRPWRRP